MARVGLMLYSVRRACAADFEATLRLIAEMGYTGVELFDLHGHAAADVRRWLDRDNLTVCGLHAPLDAVEAHLERLSETACALGTSRLIVSWVSPPASAADVARIRERLEVAALAAGKLGLSLGFHNHDGELRIFADEPALLDQLLDGVPELFLELDLGWAWFAGADPAELVTRAGARCPIVHIKDFRTREEPAYCPVGDGLVGYDVVAPAAAAAGAEWLLVEQDEVDGSELAAAARSFDALTGHLAEAS
jgi:sugar phosphate isomerase/epimerase